MKNSNKQGQHMAKKTPVQFVVFEPYGGIPETIKLGDITQIQAINLIDTLKKNSPAKTACIKSFNAKYTYNVDFDSFKKDLKNYGTLELSGMFYPDNRPQCAKCKNEDLAKAKCCARNLRAGNCQDLFIKETLGAILFPQHYGK